MEIDWSMAEETSILIGLGYGPGLNIAFILLSWGSFYTPACWMGLLCAGWMQGESGCCFPLADCVDQLGEGSSAGIGFQILQHSWMATKVDDSNISPLRLIMVYLVIGIISTILLLVKCLALVTMGLQSSKSIFSQLLSSFFRAPMSFYDSTPIGQIISRVSQDSSIMDHDVPFNLMMEMGATINAYSNLGVLAVVT